MAIINWRSFYNLLGVLLLSFYFVFYSYSLILKRKNITYRLLIWGIACLVLIVDISMNLLFSATNILSGYTFPIVTDIPIFLLIVMMMLCTMIYFTYFQWNIIREYKLNNKPVPLEKQSRLRKGSAIAMYIMLSIHFVLYGIFAYDLII